jgi:uncharacterized protein YciI
MAGQATLDELRARSHDVSLFIIFMWTTELHDLASEVGKELLREHLQWQFDLEEQGVLLGGGPLNFRYEPPPTDAPHVDAMGISIIAARSREEAERIAATEPMRMRGWRLNEVVSWNLNEGVAAALAREVVAAANRA